MVREIVEAQAETVGARLFIEAHDVAKRIEMLGLPVSAQSHDFVFIAKFQEAQELGDRAVEKSERVRKRDGAMNAHVIAVAGSPHGAGKVAEAVGG